MKTTFQDIIDGDHKKFIVNTKIFDLGRSAEIVAKVCQDKIDEDGDSAKVHCSNVIQWLNDISEQAQKLLDLREKGKTERGSIAE
mgnify:CR=1 FL=1